MQKRLCENHHSDGGGWQPDYRQLRMTCSYFVGRTTERGEIKLVAEDVRLDPTTDAFSVLVQLDPKEVISFMEGMGFRVTPVGENSEQSD